MAKKKPTPEPMPPPPDPDQAALDLQDANELLNVMTHAIETLEAEEEKLRMLKQQLSEQKRRVREAGWNLSMCRWRVRHRVMPVESMMRPENTLPLDADGQDTEGVSQGELL